MLLFLATLAALAAVPDAGALLPAAAVELVPLPGRTAPRLELDALGGRVVLRAGEAHALAGALRGRTGTICPDVGEEPGAVVLRCRSRRIAARLDGRALEIRELRGLPWAEGADGPPPMAADCGAVDGEDAIRRADCLVLAGEAARAREALEGLAGTQWGQAAAVRLGDLELAAGRFAEALGHYRAASGHGTWGRIGTARVCELTGDCLGTKRQRAVFDAAGLPPALHAELDLRAVRAHAFQGDLAGALRRLAASGDACTRAALLCRRVVLEALRSGDATVRVDALAAYAQLRDATAGPLAAELAADAAEVAAETGAPGFGGRALAATVAEAGAARLPAHLRRAAELFLAAGDRPRAELILRYAREHLPRAALASPPWRAIERGVQGEAAKPAPAPRARAARDVEADLAAARAAAARARGAAPAARDSQSTAGDSTGGTP